MLSAFYEFSTKNLGKSLGTIPLPAALLGKELCLKAIKVCLYYHR